jgi:hypothetical protein
VDEPTPTRPCNQTASRPICDRPARQDALMRLTGPVYLKA